MEDVSRQVPEPGVSLFDIVLALIFKSTLPELTLLHCFVSEIFDVDD